MIYLFTIEDIKIKTFKLVLNSLSKIFISRKILKNPLVLKHNLVKKNLNKKLNS